MQKQLSAKVIRKLLRNFRCAGILHKFMKKNRKRIILWMIPVLLVIYIAGNVISICRYSSVYEETVCDVAIVLGAAASDSGVSEVYKQRLNQARELYEKNYVAAIIVTGGLGEGNHFTDSYLAKTYLESVGVPGEAIIEENKSTITQENLENAKAIMDEKGYKTAAIVSDPLHMKRAMLLTKDAGIKAFSSPTKTSAYQSGKTKIPFVARETFFYIGYKWWRVFGRIVK